MPNLNPIIEAIGKLIGVAGEESAAVGERAAAAGKARPMSAPGRAVTSVGRTPQLSTQAEGGRSLIDVEQHLGTALTTDPVRQTQVVHDYLRNTAALNEAAATGAQEVRGIPVSIWQNNTEHLQRAVDSDPEVQDALRRLYVMRNTAPDASVRSTVVPDPAAQLEKPTVSNVVREDAPQEKRPIEKGQSPFTEKEKDLAWKDMSEGVESQNDHTLGSALERINALEPSYSKALGNLETTVTPEWQKAITYMKDLEEMAQKMQEMNVPNEDWTQMLDQFRETTGFDATELPPRVQRAVHRAESWADAMKPPTAGDIATGATGLIRGVGPSMDASWHGRQGLMLATRPEYWQSMKPTAKMIKDPVFYEQTMEELLSRPNAPLYDEAGLSMTNEHGGGVGQREEKFTGNPMDRLKGPIGDVYRAGERGFTGAGNLVRANVFDNVLANLKASGIFAGDGSAKDTKLLKSLGTWLNTSTGRGWPANVDPGILSTILFSPKLNWSRFQTFNPLYYMSLHPKIAQQALQTNAGAAAAVIALLQFAQANGAKVTYDFRDPDAGKIRINNTRFDVGGGHMQLIRFLTQMWTAEQKQSDTGRVTKLGEGGPGRPANRLELMIKFIESKESPVASLISDMLRGKDYEHKPVSWWKEVGSRLIPLAVQDAYGLVTQFGPMGLALAPLPFVGIGTQTYDSRPKVKVPYMGVNGVVPPEQAVAFEQNMMKAEADGLAEALASPSYHRSSQWVQKKMVRDYVEAHRTKARAAWIQANARQYGEAVRNQRLKDGPDEFPLTPPPEAPR